MWYLWLQILFLLALAAICGAGLAYWWLRGRYEDVTETYSTLVSGSKTQMPDLMERGTLDARLNDLANKIDRLENTDLSPIETQLLTLSNEIPNAQPELNPLIAEIQAVSEDVRRSDAYSQSIDERLAAIEANAQIASESQAGLSALEQRLESLETHVSESIKASIGNLQTVVSEKPDTDLTPILDRLTHLHEQIAQLSASDSGLASLSQESREHSERQTAGLKSEIARLEQRISALSGDLLQPLRAEIQNIATRAPTADSLAQPLEDRLRAIEDLATQSKNSFRPIHTKLDELIPVSSANANNQRSLTALDQKLMGFEESIIGIKQRMDQIGAILTTLDQRVDTGSLQSRLDQTANELTALRSSLSDQVSFDPIEQALARLQQMVFNLRERDITNLNSAIRTIENRVDFVGVENRLTSIEYGLAATHHMLRSRLEQAADLPPPPQREPYREPPKDYAFVQPASLRTPDAALDPVDVIRSPDTTGNLLVEPGFGQADNLEKIRGIGPMLRQLLNDTGVFYYWQIAEWTADDVASVDALLPGYQGRITRDRWVEQAQELSVLPTSAQRPQPFGRESKDTGL